MANTPSKYVLQVGPLIELVLGFKNKVPDTYLKNNVVEPETRVVDFLKDKSLVFSSVPEWLFFARRFDLCFGMRMHGSMVALQAGVPTVIVYHDLRTRELAERMKIPKISIADFCALKQSEICEHMHILFFDQVDAYFSRRQELASVFSDFLSAANIEMSTDFKKLVHA